MPMLGLEDIKGLRGETEESESPIDTRHVAAILLGGKRQRRRLRRMLVHELIGGTTEGDDDDTDGDDTERTLVRLLVGGRAIRRRRLRRALVAYLLSNKGSATEEDDDDDDGGIFGEANGDGGSEKTLLKALVAGKGVRRNRLRKALVAKLLRGAGSEDVDEDDEDEGIFGETNGDGGDERTLLKALVGGRMIRRNRLRKALVAKLARGAASEEDDDDDDDNERGDIVSFLLGRGAQRRKTRRFALAKLLGDAS